MPRPTASAQRISRAPEGPVLQRLLFYVSGHGFGHATRTRALIARLLRSSPSRLDIHVRSEAPHWIFQERDAGVRCSRASCDVGILQQTGMEVDVSGSLAAHEAFLRNWDRRVDEEAGFIEAFAPSLVVADIPPLAFAAAARARLAAIGMANFSWDWIAGHYAAHEPRWAPISECYADAYSLAESVYRLPLHSDFAAFPQIVDMPFVVNHSRHTRAACREQLGISPDDQRRLVLFSFGGFGAGKIAGDSNDDLSDYHFITVGEAPAGIGGGWTSLPRTSAVAHEDLMQACDAVLGKTGFGTVAEALAHGVRFLHVPRAGFPETPLLETGLHRLGCAVAMQRCDFEAGRWRTSLDALFDLPPPPPPPAINGAEHIATALIERLG